MQIVINYDEKTGNVNVMAPFEQKMLCYGLIEITRDLIKDWKKGDIIKPEFPATLLEKINNK
jgi:hypothetical protein